MAIRFIMMLALLCALPAQAADTYGYVGFWRDVQAATPIPHTKTTRENSNARDAQREMQAFCRELDRRLPAHQSGCFALTAVKNQCVAAAWSVARGLLSPDNLFVARAGSLHDAQDAAKAQCQQAEGVQAACEVETAFCTDAQMYSTQADEIKE